MATRDETVRKGPVGFESVQKGKNLTPELLRQLDTNLDTAAHEATVRKRFRRSESVHKGTNLTSESLGPRDTSLTVAAHDEPIRKRPRRCENVYETPELPSVTNEEQQQVCIEAGSHEASLTAAT